MPIRGNIPLGDPRRHELLAKVLELLPTPERLVTAQHERDTDAPPTVPAIPFKTKQAFKKKLAKVRNRVLRRPEVGLTVVDGNIKIGVISQFSLPAGQHFRGASCPGATELCESLCYAKSELFSFHEAKYYANWAYVLLWPGEFADVWTGSARHRAMRLKEVTRIHVGGDFFEPWYADLWADIIDRRRDVRFYAYTRSWQDGRRNIREDFLPSLERLAQLPNMRLVLSVDRETGIPPRDLIPGSIRAWLATDDEDLPEEPLELIFRDKSGIQSNQRVMANTPVCPVERLKKYKKSAGKVNCRNCTWCWSTGFKAYGERDDDPAAFDAFARANVNKLVKGRFGEFAPGEHGPSMSGPVALDEGVCVCDLRVLCGECGCCVECVCQCPQLA